MAIGRISGPLLKENLIRNGVNLAFETDLLYLDVNNQRVGINTNTPQYDLDVNGTSRTTNLLSTVANIGPISISNSTISTSNNTLTLGTLDNVVYQKTALIDDLKFENNTISTTTSNANLELRPSGTGAVEIATDLNVTGNIHADGNITANGNIVLGDQATDTITFNAEISSDLIPTQDNFYTIGSQNYRWSDIWVETFNSSIIETDNLTVGNVDLTLRQGNIYYVSVNGEDTNDGDHPQSPFGTIKHALSVAAPGETIFIFPGIYEEIFPLTIPTGVSLRGQGIRAVTIRPTVETRYNDAFLMNGESTVEDLMVTGFYSGGNYFQITDIVDVDTIKINVGTAGFAHTYVSGGTVDFSDSTAAVNVNTASYNHVTGELTIDLADPHDSYIGHTVFVSGLIFSCTGGAGDTHYRTFPDNGYAFRFATDFEVTTRSPYVRNITVITAGSVTTAEDPRGFNAGDAGKGAYIDGAYATTNSIEASLLFHSVTFITPGVDCIICTNGVRVEWLNSFTYFANRSFYAFDRGHGKYLAGKTHVRLSGITGTFQAGDTITFTSTDASTVIAKTIDSVNGDIVSIVGRQIDLLDFDTTPQSIVGTNGATATTIEFVDFREFGAEIRMIGSASVYGNYGLYGDGAGVIVYAIGHNLAYIGNGKEVTNDPITVIQGNEVVQLNSAKIRYTSVDHRGDFRVGDLFYINQESGQVNFAVSALNIQLTDALTLTDGTNNTVINGTSLETGNIRLSLNTIETTTGNLNLKSATDDIIINDNVNIQGNLQVNGNYNVTGNVILGNDQNTDEITINSKFANSIIPNLTNTYDLGNPTYKWQNLYITELNLDNIQIRDNFITTTTSNSDLELRASGTGRILIPNNNVVVNEDLTVLGSTVLNNTSINGNLNLTGNLVQSGNATINGNIDVGGDLIVNSQAIFNEILIKDNFITTTTSNSDLELRASGTGRILVPNNNFVVNENLTVNGSLYVQDFQVTNKISANEFYTSDIQIKDNFITTFTSNSDLELRASGTGNINIDDLIFANATISSASTIFLDSATNVVEISSNGGFIVPKGDTSQRSNTPLGGEIRFNTQLVRFEGYDGTKWFNLTGVENASGDTKVIANDSNIEFYVQNALVATLDNNNFTIPELIVDDITINGNTITSNNADLEITANGTGSVVLDKISFNGSTISNTSPGDIFTIETNGTGYVEFTGTDGIIIPTGTSLDRGVGVPGLIRYNTTDARVELYDGTIWTSLGGQAAGLTYSEAIDLSISNALIFG